MPQTGIWRVNSLEDMAVGERPGVSNWIGPVLGAVILIVGYIAYQQWHEQDEHKKQCASLVRSFTSNFNSMTAPLGSAIDQAQSQHSQAPMAQPSLVIGAAAGETMMQTLDAQCPGWKELRYDH